MQIATLDWAGNDALDVFLSNRYVGTIAAANTTKVRAYFNANATSGSQRRFENAQSAIAYLLARREKRLSRKAAA